MPPTKFSTRFSQQHVVKSDYHKFIGRVFDLSIVEMNFDTFEELSEYPDCTYVHDVNFWTTMLVERVESLNRAGDMIWIDSKYLKQKKWPISKYEWLNFYLDTFLMRTVSIVDCALILTNHVLELGLEEKKCNIGNIKRLGANKNIIKALNSISTELSHLTTERNERFHRGIERPFSSDDMTFKTVSLYEHRGTGMIGDDRNGKKIDTDRYMRESLSQLQKIFNRETKKIERKLDNIYDALLTEFNPRFSEKFRNPATGYGSKIGTPAKRTT